MLRESDIDSLNNHLTSVARDNQRHHDELQDLLGKFKGLLEDYSSLKSDYEEEKVTREKYKKQARGQVWKHMHWLPLSPAVRRLRMLTIIQDRNPFVLVLIDGDGYMVGSACCAP